MSKIHVECAVQARLPKTKTSRTFAAQFRAEQEQTRKIINRAGGLATTWLGGDWFGGKNLHKWAVVCDEVALTALTLVCKSVTITER